jgi:hypothetical protein
VVWVSKRTPYRRASVVQKRVVVQGVYGHLEMEEVRVERLGGVLHTMTMDLGI